MVSAARAQQIDIFLEGTMRFRKVAIAGLALAPATTAYADIDWSWTGVPITATTDPVTPAPGIQGYQCLDINITLTPGDDFTEARIFMDPQGSIFHHAIGQPGPNFGPPNSALFATFPVLEFDSYLRSTATGGSVQVYGSFDGTNVGPPPGVFNNDFVGVAFTDPSVNTSGGTFQMMRLNFGPGPIPWPMYVEVYSVEEPVPEAATLGLAAACVPLLIGRRRGRCR
jgi:hypothetical protein